MRVEGCRQSKETLTRTTRHALGVRRSTGRLCRNAVAARESCAPLWRKVFLLCPGPRESEPRMCSKLSDRFLSGLKHLRRAAKCLPKLLRLDEVLPNRDSERRKRSFRCQHL